MRAIGRTVFVIAVVFAALSGRAFGVSPAPLEGTAEERTDGVRAAALFQEVLDGWPRESAAPVEGLRAAWQGGDPLATEGQIEDAVAGARGGDKGRLLLSLGLVRLARGQTLAAEGRGTRSTLVALFRDAARSLEAARDAGESGDALVLGLAEAHEWAERPDLAESELRNAIAAGPSAIRLGEALVLLLSRQAGREGEARAAAREYLVRADLRPEERVAVQLAAGRLELAAGDVDRAFDAYAALLEATPSLQAVYDDAWTTTAERSRFDLLERLLSLVVARFPGEAKASYYRGHARLRENRPAEAAADFEEALRRDPTLREARLGLAEARRRDGKRLEAAAVLEALVAARPDDADALDALRSVAEEIAIAGDDAAARRLFEAVSRARPGDRETRVNWAVASARTGRLDEARRILAEGLAIDPSDGRLRNELGIACESAGDLASAEREYRAALEADWNFDAAENLAFLLLRTGRKDAALPILIDVLRRDPLRIRSAIAYERATRS